jgi:glutamate dehydrogenase (NAD(P)+)
MECGAMRDALDPDAPIRILLIEDSNADAHLISLCLQDSDPLHYRLVICEALGKGIERLDEGFDLVLLDLILPDSTPEETFARFRAAAPELPIVVLSATQDDRLAKRCIEQGARAFMAKSSLSPQAIGAVVRGATRRERSD